jgi:hypothetical protein
MCKSVFVFITQEALLAKVANLTKFAPPLGLNKNDRFFLLPGPEVKESLNEADLPDLILVHDQIPVEWFDENIGRIASGYDKIYLSWHENGKIYPDFITKCIFFHKIKEKMGQHNSGDKLYMAAVKWIRGDEDAFDYAVHVFEGDPLLNGLIAIYKELSLMPLKLPLWEEEGFKQRLQSLQDKENVISIIERLKDLEFKDKVDNFYEQLLPIENEIKRLSAAK